MRRKNVPGPLRVKSKGLLAPGTADQGPVTVAACSKTRLAADQTSCAEPLLAEKICSLGSVVKIAGAV